MIMAGQILVPFNSHLRVEDIISVIEEAAKPGMRVVFLVRYPVDPWVWFRDHWVTTESSRDAMLLLLLAGGALVFAGGGLEQPPGEPPHGDECVSRS